MLRCFLVLLHLLLNEWGVDGVILLNGGMNRVVQITWFIECLCAVVPDLDDVKSTLGADG
jgi:hypothetical protein